jgi:ATP-dependent exoDNAse (exonuclease V) alpha subunit
LQGITEEFFCNAFLFSLAREDMNYDTSNKMFELAAELVNQSAVNIFLTGKAGTGKTTFLKWVRENCPKQMVVVAPTGVAAINAGGVTIHSFFQLPLSPFIPETNGFDEKRDEAVNPHSLLSRLRMTNDKKRILHELELLIIDEISMVRCDILDEIDLVLRHIRHRHKEPFGGVQVLFIGDMFQLPPVVKDDEWRILSEYYAGPFFFDSKVIQQAPPVYIEFAKIYRQSEENFINLLNQVRNNELDEKGKMVLQSRYQPGFNTQEHKEHIILTTHNEKARNMNSTELGRLQINTVVYKAEVKDDFPASAYPADELLQLKVGAKVMFIKNDSDKSKRYFNGKTGVITELEDEKIFVQCPGEPSAIEVKKETWGNIRYTVNKTTRHLEEQVLGSFTQYPLRLAWAITIHKSQGLTFEKAVIDAGEAFAPGQIYVALSRCSDLEGMVLLSSIRSRSLFTDERVLNFSKTAATTEKLQEELDEARATYQQKTLLSLFDFSRVVYEAEELQRYILQHNSSFNAITGVWIENLLKKLLSVQNTSEKFYGQLISVFAQAKRLGENIILQQRINAAATYFLKKIKNSIEFILQSPALTDSRLSAKEYYDSLREIFAQLSLKKFLLEGLGGKFDMETFHKQKRNFAAPSFLINAYGGAEQKRSESAHPALYQQLRKLRDNICSKKDLPIYMVAGSQTLNEMTTYLPQTIEELEQISGFGKIKLEAYGKQFLEVIQGYCNEEKLISQIAERTPKRRRKENKESKADTKAESFRLYKMGKTVGEIAEERSLTTQTIESHLSYYVQKGLIGIEELVSREKLILIEPMVIEFRHGNSITPIKEKLGNDVSYGDIRLVIAWTDFKKNSSPHVDH